MASSGYPKVTAKAWRELRSRAATAPSTRFTPPVVASLMGMASPESARDNTVNPMRKLGLIDDDGALTARGNKWRVDASYAEACQEILDEVYPSDLSALVDGSGLPNPQLVKTWFDHKGFGGSNSQQMAATYVMVASKQVPEMVASERKKTSQPKERARKAAASTARTTSATAEAPVDLPPNLSNQNPFEPNMHLNIQIHIPADASPEQIDRIFESMARHLYNR